MNAASRLIEVRVPDMGNFKDVAIIDVLVKPGVSIEPEAPLVTLETEKATMDVPSTVGGIIEKVHVAKGGTVSTGDLIATVRSEAGPEAVAEPDAPAAEQKPARQPAGDAQAPRPALQPAAGAAGSAARGTIESDVSGAAEGVASGVAGGVASGVAGGVASGPAEGVASGPAEGAVSQATGTAVTEAPTAPAAAVPSNATRGTTTRNGLPPINEPGFSRAHAGPSVRKFARELGVDLTQVSSTGFKGRVTHDDVKAFVKKHLAGSPGTGAVAGGIPGGGIALPAVPIVDFAQFGPTETKPLSRIQRISGPRLHASWVNIPHVTQFDEADITDLEDARTKLKQKALQEGIKLTPLAFVIRACVKALQEFPVFNASLDASGANLVLKKYVNIGFAADTPNGLVVPVMREANRRDIYEIARQLGELSERARAGKLSPADMQGGCFTVSSLGGIGGTAFTPIINAPEVAILGVSRSTMRPVFRDGAFIARLLLPLSLSYDHRVIDGATAARFTTFLAHTLADPRGLMEAVP